MTSASEPHALDADSTVETTAQPAAPKSSAREVFDLFKTVFYALLIALVLRVVLFQPFTIPSASMEPTLYEGDYIVVSKFAYGWSKNSIPFSPPLFSGRLMARQPVRGDVVVFKLPRDGHVDYIKRLVGLPGDHIQVKQGLLYINGAVAPRVALGERPTTCPNAPGQSTMAPLSRETLPGGRTHLTAACLAGQGGANDTGVYVVPPNCYFMMGDNRDNSVDSRFPPYHGQATDAAMAACPYDPDLISKLGMLDDGVGFVPFDNLEGKADMILFSWTPGASLFKPWTWVLNLRLSRWLHFIT